MYCPLLLALSWAILAQDPPAPPPPPKAPPAQVEQEPRRHDLAGPAGPVGVWDLSGRIPALWPVRAADGTPVTRDFPFANEQGEKPDHPHHVSLWTAHGDVNGVDFWHDPKARIVPVGRSSAAAGPKEHWVQEALEWRGPDGTVHLYETRRITVTDRGGIRLIDRDHHFTAPKGRPAVFGDTKEGCFALRVRRELCPDHGGSLLNSAGQKDGKAWGQPAAWIRYEGIVAGKPLGVALFDHPENPRHPTRWHARTYGLAAANPFALHHFTGAKKGTATLTLPPGDTLRFRHRIALYHTPLTPPQLTALAPN